MIAESFRADTLLRRKKGSGEPFPFHQNGFEIAEDEFR
jgi:hypothetical protein